MTDADLLYRLEPLSVEGLKGVREVDVTRAGFVFRVDDGPDHLVPFASIAPTDGSPLRDHLLADAGSFGGVTCVGERDWFDDPPYFRLWTTPPITIRVTKDYDVWEDFQWALHKAGHRTFDMG